MSNLTELQEQLHIVAQALAPFARYARLALEQAAARDAVLRDADIVFRLDTVAITVEDMRRAVDALNITEA